MRRLVLLTLLCIIVLLSATGCKELLQASKDGGATGQVVKDGSGEGAGASPRVKTFSPDVDPKHLLNGSGKKEDGAAGQSREFKAPAPQSVCGDDKCDGDEDCASCEEDCACGTWEVCEDATCQSVACFEDRDCGKASECLAVRCLMAGTPKASCEQESLCLTSGGSSATRASVCGDGVCDADEDVTSCEVDCRACNDGVDNDGDGFIDFGGDAECKSASDNSEFAFCGNHVCESWDGENSGSCMTDCPHALVSWPSCNNETPCAPNYYPCTSDNATNGTCHPRPQCSDTLDNDGDHLTDYPNDPKCLDPDDLFEAPYCGDYVCEGYEHYGNCPDDCVATCGNGACEDLAGENRTNCVADCSGMTICGDGTCDTAYESTASCPFDCYCGDGICEASESGVPFCGIDCS